MPSDSAGQIHLMHLEDQINRMNLVLTEQGRVLSEQTEMITILINRIKMLEAGSPEHMLSDSAGPSELPPDGVNR